MGTLSITVCSSILGTCSIEFALATVLLHLHKVQSTIQTTSKLRIVNSESELLGLEFQQLVVVIFVKLVQA